MTDPTPTTTPTPPEGLTDEQLLELMPQQFRDDLATVSRLASYDTPVGPGLYRVSLNTGALAFARAVLARWGGAAVPVPVSDGWPEFSDCDDFERVHCFNPVLGHWKLSKINPSIHTHWLPRWSLPVPAAAAGEVQP